MNSCAWDRKSARSRHSETTNSSLSPETILSIFLLEGYNVSWFWIGYFNLGHYYCFCLSSHCFFRAALVLSLMLFTVFTVIFSHVELSPPLVLTLLLVTDVWNQSLYLTQWKKRVKAELKWDFACLCFFISNLQFSFCARVLLWSVLDQKKRSLTCHFYHCCYSIQNSVKNMWYILLLHLLAPLLHTSHTLRSPGFCFLSVM